MSDDVVDNMLPFTCDVAEDCTDADDTDVEDNVEDALRDVANIHQDDISFADTVVVPSDTLVEVSPAARAILPIHTAGSVADQAFRRPAPALTRTKI